MNLELLNDKYIFIDFDGTLCEYRYFGHLSGKTADDVQYFGGQSLEELLFENYEKVRPLKTMQNLLKHIDNEKIYVLGAIVTYNEIKTKIKWLKKHFPFIKEEHLIFVADLNIKTDVLKLYSKKLNIPYGEMIFIDDKLDSLRNAEEQGIPSYHITSFME